MRFYIGNTDYAWFEFHRSRGPLEVNFWKPGERVVRTLDRGAPFLLRLMKPYNAIVGVGFFSSSTHLPISMAWEVFAEQNGFDDFNAFRRKILSLRKDKWNENPTIGCNILADPIFFNRNDWIDTPADWPRNTQEGKYYDTGNLIGETLWDKVEALLRTYMGHKTIASQNQLIVDNQASNRYKESILAKIRLGQGAFRVLITDAYTRRCSISGEKTLPVLEAAHIKPYSKEGPHLVSNGLLLRADLHKLFDQGYLTVTTSFKVEISKRIREEFENGRDYYKYQGSELLFMPKKAQDKPSAEFIEWHNEEVFKG